MTATEWGLVAVMVGVGAVVWYVVCQIMAYLGEDGYL